MYLYVRIDNRLQNISFFSHQALGQNTLILNPIRKENLLVEELEMEEADPAELPDDPPSPLKKAMAGWELSEQQDATQSLSQKE